MQGASFCFLIFFLEVIAPPPSIRWSQISGFSAIELNVDLVFLNLMVLCYEIYWTAQKANTGTYKFTTRNHHHLQVNVPATWILWVCFGYDLGILSHLLCKWRECGCIWLYIFRAFKGVSQFQSLLGRPLLPPGSVIESGIIVAYRISL